MMKNGLCIRWEKKHLRMGWNKELNVGLNRKKEREDHVLMPGDSFPFFVSQTHDELIISVSWCLDAPYLLHPGIACPQLSMPIKGFANSVTAEDSLVSIFWNTS